MRRLLFCGALLLAGCRVAGPLEHNRDPVPVDPPGLSIPEQEMRARDRMSLPAETIMAGQVFCCSYAQLNAPGAASGFTCVPLKHELTEMALVEPPAVGVPLIVPLDASRLSPAGKLPAVTDHV